MLTLRTAYQDYLRGRGHELSPRSIGWMDQKLNYHLSDLLDIPLASFTKSLSASSAGARCATSIAWSAKAGPSYLIVVCAASATAQPPSDYMATPLQEGRGRPPRRWLRVLSRADPS